MTAPQTVLTLVENFERNLDAYRSGKYNETQVRRDFIDPLFKALGWDMDNSAGYAEAYRDVIHEDAIKIGNSTKAPDYSFRVGGQRKFFLEAKKPSVNVKEDVEPAFQLRRYAWSAKLPLSIVTDFEEFAIYDCRAKPDKGDKASKARLFYCKFNEYAEKWDEIAAIFSKDAVLKGSFDKYATTSKGKRGTSEVDGAFLEEIEGWRDLLARNIALRNSAIVGAPPGRDSRAGHAPTESPCGLSQRELNFAVQQTIDRIIFLRICEDRGIEPYGRLMALQNGVNVYDRLRELFREADDRYNSGLFHFKREKGRAEAPDELTLGLEIDDKPLKEIFKNLYYPDCPYEFSVLGAEILGSVYEQFLGKVIRLTAGNRAVVEDKPEVKKAGGVFYTPAYIVKYIVENTVGKLLEGKTPKQAKGIAILDPACGSGSFLIGAYQYLLDWYLARYVEEGAEKHSKGKEARLRHSASGEWRLTTSEKKRILLEHLYGVDIDAQAVEVTKLSLLLKMLEGESDETLNSQMKLFHERVLPDLERNIQCGNSLIGPDFYDGQLDLDNEAAQRINVFDWQAAFPHIFQIPPNPPLSKGGNKPQPPLQKGGERSGGGFDVVIGNPPYVRQETLGDFKGYFQSHYEAFDGVADLYAYFMEKGVKLLKNGGLFSIIVSSSFLRTTYGRSLRQTLKKQAAVLRLLDFGGLAVFANAKDTYVCIPLLQKGAQPKNIEVARVTTLDNLKLDDYVRTHRYTVPHSRFNEEAWSIKSDDEAALFDKITKAGKPLGEYVKQSFFRGVTTGLNEAFVIDTETKNRLIAQDRCSAELIKPLLGGEDIRRYLYRKTDKWLIFTRRGVDIARYPAIREHLSQWKEDLTPKKDKSAKRGRKPGRYEWYEIQDDVAYFDVFEGPKIFFPDICKAPRFTLDTSGTYLANTAYCLGTDDRYLLGILNSRLFWFAISHISIPFGVRAGEYRYRLIYQYMEKVPIRVINSKDKNDRTAHDEIVKLVEKMLALHQQIAVAKTPQDTNLLQRQIAATDKQIDQLVYQLYGLTDEEIALVEGNA
ncbi:MAG: restriction endonuclease subunit R [Gallionellales bacterium RIFCSPLOWO2_12_FULL_59_22]|nr:MAG: restriction endonuclease subunit R [Gallionellales bacterium RIFCSPLOWO2_02_58_13]OGT13381.1 MAG: restriction endonuclease subunit R [Gallionellales bacterium RIFCSPLOWO2_12_FULL_59_22]